MKFEIGTQIGTQIDTQIGTQIDTQDSLITPPISNMDGPLYGYAISKQQAMDRWGLDHMLVYMELADFYLLYHLSLEGKAIPEFNTKLDYLEKQFSAYTDMVVGGELRHAASLIHLAYLKAKFPKPLVKALKDGHLPDDRHAAWLGWYFFRLTYGTVALLWAEKIFPFLGGGIGGGEWANITHVLRLYETGKISKMIFVDTCWGLQHNGGVYLNKIWNTTNVKMLLSAKRASDMEVLVLNASDEVIKLWNGSEAAKS